MTARRPEFDLTIWIAEQRFRQGLPPKVEDEAILMEVAHRVLAVLNTTTPRGCHTPRRRIDRPTGQQEGHRDATRHP